MKIEKLSTIKQTTDYDRFITDTMYVNRLRIEMLKMVAEEGNGLPLVEVIRSGDRLEIIGDQDSYYASKSLKLPVIYYESFRPINRQNKIRKKLIMQEFVWDDLIRYCKGDYRCNE